MATREKCGSKMVENAVENTPSGMPISRDVYLISVTVPTVPYDAKTLSMIRLISITLILKKHGKNLVKICKKEVQDFFVGICIENPSCIYIQPEEEESAMKTGFTTWPAVEGAVWLIPPAEVSKK